MNNQNIPQALSGLGIFCVCREISGTRELKAFWKKQLLRASLVMHCVLPLFICWRVFLLPRKGERNMLNEENEW